jgi:circadian clock protein KaiC
VAKFHHEALDEMVGGGLRTGSTTLVLGPTGTGKTLLGLSFLAAGMRQGDRAIYAGFYEAPPRVVAGGNNIGLQLRRHVDAGLLHIDWQAPVEVSLDLWGHRVLAAVHEHRPTRLFLDGFNALQDSAAYPARLSAFLTAFLNELRSLGVTTFMSVEVHPIVGPGVDVPVSGISPMVENTILLRYVEVRSHLFRLIAVLKVRGSEHQTAMREFRITSRGLEVAATFESAEAILTGSARQTAPTARDDRDAK